MSQKNKIKNCTNRSGTEDARHERVKEVCREYGAWYFMNSYSYEHRAGNAIRVARMCREKTNKPMVVESIFDKNKRATSTKHLRGTSTLHILGVSESEGRFILVNQYFHFWNSAEDLMDHSLCYSEVIRILKEANFNSRSNMWCSDWTKLKGNKVEKLVVDTNFTAINQSNNPTLHRRRVGVQDHIKKTIVNNLMIRKKHWCKNTFLVVQYVVTSSIVLVGIHLNEKSFAIESDHNVNEQWEGRS